MLQELMIKIRALADLGGFNQVTSAMRQMEAAGQRMGGTGRGAFSQISTNAGTASAQVSKLGNTTNSVSAQMSRLGTAGTHINRVGDAANASGQKLNQMGSAGRNAGNSTASGMKSASAAANELSGTITGVVSTLGLMEMASQAVTGSFQRETNQQMLALKYGAESSNAIVRDIENVVARVPGDDVFMNKLLTLQAYRGGITNPAGLQEAGEVIASYVNAVQSFSPGVQKYVEMEIQDYILTGNTALMQRDSIYRNHLDKLKDIDTVEGRIAALKKLQQEYGDDQLINLDTAAIKWEIVKGIMQKAFADLGDKALPYIKKLLDIIIELDEKTGGWSTQMGLIGIAAIGIIGSLSMLKTIFNPAIKGAELLLEKLGLINKTKCTPCPTNYTGAAPGKSKGGISSGTAIAALTITAATVYLIGSAITYGANKANETEPQSQQAVEAKSFLDTVKENPIGKGFSAPFNFAYLGMNEHPNDLLGALGSSLGWMGVGVGKALGIETGQPKGGVDTSTGFLEGLWPGIADDFGINKGGLLDQLSKIGNPLDWILPKTALATGSGSKTGFLEQITKDFTPGGRFALPQIEIPDFGQELQQKWNEGKEFILNNKILGDVGSTANQMYTDAVDWWNNGKSWIMNNKITGSIWSTANQMFTDARNWWNQTWGHIRNNGITGSIWSTANSMYNDAKYWWDSIWAYISNNPITGFINYVTGGAGGDGGYGGDEESMREAGLSSSIPTYTAGLVTNKTSSSSSSTVIVSEGAIGPFYVDSNERARDVAQEVTNALSKWNDDRGN